MCDQNASPDEAIYANLKAGSALTSGQLPRLVSSLDDSKSAKEIAAILETNTGAFLDSLASTIDDESTGLKSTEIPAIAAKVARLILSNMEKSVSGVILQMVENEAAPSKFIFTLYLTFCTKRNLASASSVPVLLSSLASADKYISEMSLFILMSMSRSVADMASHVTRRLEAILLESPDLGRNFSVVAKAIECFFPVYPEAMEKIYVSEKCKQAFLYQGLLINPEKDTSDSSTAQQLLQVLSLSCIREGARKFNTENYLPLLIEGTKIGSANSASIRALSLLCVVKLWNFSAIEKKISLDSVFAKILELFVDASPDSFECTALLEALAYLSLGTATKKALRANELAIEQLVMLLETSADPSVIYGCLLVVQNLCRAKAGDLHADADANTLNYLKSMAEPKHGNKADEDPQEILNFNQALILEHKLVGTLAGLKHGSGHENIASSIAHIVHSLSHKQVTDVQRQIVVQGGLNLTIKYLVEHSKVAADNVTCPVSEDENAVETRTLCLGSLATFCWSVNPSVAFSKYDVKTCVPFLVELLALAPADRLCSLLALTNLSSLADPDLHASITSRAFDAHLRNLMIDNTHFAVQRGAWELINNLVAHPLMLAKFFNPDSAESRRNLDVLVKMLHSENEALQIVIAGLFANATMEFDLVSVSILSQPAIFANLCKITASIFVEQAQTTDLILRVATFLLHLAMVAAESVEPALEKMRSDLALKAGIKKVVVTTKSSDVMALLRDTIQLTGMKF